MRSALGLYGLLLLLATRPVLHQRHWVDRAPRLGILAWQASSVGLISALLLLALLPLAPVTGVEVDLGHLVHACRAALTGHDVGLAELALLLAAVLVLLALCRIGFRQVSATRRVRRRQRALIDLVTTPLPGSGPPARLLDHDTPLAYCVPGRGPRIVVTTGARDTLSRRDLDLVLRHEQAHLRGRHHLVLQWARVLRTAVPLPVFRAGETETAHLVEMVADDAVVEAADRRSLAHAVLALSGPGPAGVLGAGVSVDGTQRRVARLLSLPRALPRAQRWALSLASVAVVALPWVTVTPALAAWSGRCPLPA